MDDNLRKKIEKDPDYLFKLEKEIEKKYGASAIKNPLSEWSKEDEKRYLEQVRESYKKKKISFAPEVFEKSGFFVRGKLFTKDKKECSVCGKYSFCGEDDFYLNRYGMCFLCFDKTGGKKRGEQK